MKKTFYLPQIHLKWSNSLAVITIIAIFASCASPHYTYQAQQARREAKKQGTNLTTVSAPKLDNSTLKENTVTKTKTGKAAPVLKKAESFLGTKYKYGGNTRSGIDCSGLMCVSFKQGGIALPRVSSDQARQGTAVAMNDLKEGDLLFFTYPGGSKITHVGVVEEVKGPNEVIFIHASSSRGVTRDNLYSSYFKKVFVKARRVL
ncbi:C40 family peptidase [Sediminitomix flava]|uniref:Cell wall-associated NlpC family hydrolase n=1 Tax=Sediminitomix flava TaxID=379075 RepID=A0A315ZBH7_SEDFL|nr:C40 family peptidase [Sediminitomix flava]PWJ42936.1 cell wall-associated NlpC family hydrolase [Sediminitomix flava]